MAKALDKAWKKQEEEEEEDRRRKRRKEAFGSSSLGSDGSLSLVTETERAQREREREGGDYLAGRQKGNGNGTEPNRSGRTEERNDGITRLASKAIKSMKDNFRF